MPKNSIGHEKIKSAGALEGAEYIELSKFTLAQADINIIDAHQKPLESPWQEKAACIALPDPEVFFGGPEGANAARKKQCFDLARLVCDKCMVRDACLSDAISIAETEHGMRAGKLPDEINKIKKRAA